MNYNKQLISEILINLSENLNLNYKDQVKANETLENILSNYTVNKNELIVIGNNFADNITLYLQTKRIEGIKDGTLKNYFYLLKRLAESINKNVNDVTINDLRKFINIECENNKPSTMSSKIDYIKGFFSWMYDEEIIDRDVSKKLPKVKVPKKLRKGLNLEEIELLRIACNTSRERAILEILLATGCRISEVINMNIDDIDFTHNKITVVGKGDKEREVLFNDKTKIYIKKYLDDRQDNNKALFVSSKKPYDRLQRKGMWRLIHNIGINSNIDKAVFAHLMRHSFADNGLKNGADITTISFLLGHSNLSTTQKYAETNNENIKYEYNRYMIQ